MERLRSARRELTAESMRTATLVGLASIPVGFLWIYLFGTQSGAVLLATGIVVGVLYSDKPTPAHRAGARAGIFAPIPELTAQSASNLVATWELSMGLGLRVILSAVVVGFLIPVAWVLFALFVIFVAFGTAWMVQRIRPYASNTARTRS